MAFTILPVENGQFYIRNEAAIAEIVNNIRSLQYTIILGPPHCQKSLLLRDIRDRVCQAGMGSCVLLNLKEIEYETDEEFYSGFVSQLTTCLRSRSPAPPPAGRVTNERDLHTFFHKILAWQQTDLLLLLDHLEAVRTGPIRSLLKVLRAVFDEQSPDTPFHLVVVATSSLRVSGLSLGPTSPFNIAVHTFVHDLEHAQGKELARHILAAAGLSLKLGAVERLIAAAGGDRHLIPRLCSLSQEIAQERGHTEVGAEEIGAAINRFLKQEAGRHPSLVETVRAIEARPDNLSNVLRILEKKAVPRRDLDLDLSLEMDDLQLTGAVRVDPSSSEPLYRIRSEIYERYLKAHFHPDRVVHAFTLAGGWAEALAYLHQRIKEHPDARSLLLRMVINSINAARSLDEVAPYLASSISLAFQAPRVRIYRVNPERSSLLLISQAGFPDGELADTIPLDHECLESGAFRSHDAVVQRTPEGDGLLLAPLLLEEVRRLGLAVLHDFEAGQQDDDYLELLTFLKQASRAIGNVIDQEQKIRQLDTLNQVGKQVTSSLDLDHTLQATVKAAIVAVPAAQKGSLFLWDETSQRLVIRAQQGFRPDIVNTIQLKKGAGYAGWVYEHRRPLLLGNVLADPRTRRSEHPEVLQEKSAISVPLEAWGRVMGVLCLDNISAFDAFQESDLDLLATFGAQAAIAIQNARLYTGLYSLGMSINRGDLDPAAIFQRTVESLIQVSDARGANLLLLRDTGDPELCLTQRPLLSVAHGLSADFPDQLQIRPDGLTYRVLKSRAPEYVCDEQEAPGINSLPRSLGIRACLCLPLTVHDAVIGVLFAHYDKPHEFSQNEIEMLSLFANQVALAMETARQREDLELYENVAWIGIAYTGLAHRITQKAGSIRNKVYGLKKLIGRSPLDLPVINTWLEEIRSYASILDEVPVSIRSLTLNKLEAIDLNGLLRQDLARWCQPEPEIQLDLHGLSPEEMLVRVDLHRLKIALEILADNAVQAMRSLPEKRLEVRSRVQSQRVVVDILNTGEVPEERRALLFNRPVVKRPGEEGTGIGTLIVGYTMRHFGGGIELIQDSPPGLTHISFWLPLCAS